MFTSKTQIRCSMGKTIYTKEQKQLAYEMYWTDRKEVKLGRKPGRYSLREISKVTGMDRTYISKIGRGMQ